MAQLLKRTIRVAIDIEVTAQDIDAEVIRRVAGHFHHGDEMLSDPGTQEVADREQRLLLAMLANPEALQITLHDLVVSQLEDLSSPSSPLREDIEPYEDDEAFIETLRGDLSEDDLELWDEVMEDNVFGENTEFYREAMEAVITGMSITDVTEPLEDGRPRIDFS